MSIEKRQFPRITVTCKISCAFANRLLVFNCHTENISVGGIRVILEEKLHVSTIVDVELFVLGKEIPVKCKGQIVWVKEIKPLEIRPRLFDTGIKFIEINDFQKEEINKLVVNFLSQESRE